eukprot:2447932-Prymnesium_polylepis.1
MLFPGIAPRPPRGRPTDGAPVLAARMSTAPAPPRSPPGRSACSRGRALCKHRTRVQHACTPHGTQCALSKGVVVCRPRGAQTSTPPVRSEG